MSEARLWIMVSVPYTANAPPPELRAANLRRMNAAALGRSAIWTSTTSTSPLPGGRISALRASLNTARAQAVERMPDDRRLGTLLAFAHTLARTACDDVLPKSPSAESSESSGIPQTLSPTPLLNPVDGSVATQTPISFISSRGGAPCEESCL